MKACWCGLFSVIFIAAAACGQSIMQQDNATDSFELRSNIAKEHSNLPSKVIEISGSSMIEINIDVPIAGSDGDALVIENAFQKLPSKAQAQSTYPSLLISLTDAFGNPATNVSVNIIPVGWLESGYRARVRMWVLPTDEDRINQVRDIVANFIQTEVRSGGVDANDNFLTSFESNFEKRTSALARAYPVNVPGEYVARIELEFPGGSHEKLSTPKFTIRITPDEDPISKLLSHIRSSKSE